VLELVESGFDHGDGELVFYEAPDSTTMMMKAVEQFIQVIDPILNDMWVVGRLRSAE
jgi:hypothetical protein